MNYFDYDINNDLNCEKVVLKELAKKVNTPFYVYSSANIIAQYRLLQKQLLDVDYLIAYSVKANSNISIIKVLASMGAGADVVSVGELRRVLKAGIVGKKIVFSGVGKRDYEISEALDAKILQFNVESLAELELIANIALNKNLIAPVAIRINPNVSAGGHPKISTGKDTDKFGISYLTANKVYSIAKKYKSINVVGIDMHIGSQITTIEPFEDAFSRITELYTELTDMGHKIINLDLGGGLGINYQNKLLIDNNLVKSYGSILRNVYNKTKARIIIEPGRFLVGSSGLLVTRIIYKKEELKKNFLIVDAGMNDFLRPALYSAKHKIKSLKLYSRESVTEKFDIVGPICETADIIGSEIKLPNSIQAGDLIAISSVGAYGAVMSSNYNSRSLIAEVLIKDSEFQVIREVQDFDDIIKYEKLTQWF